MFDSDQALLPSKWSKHSETRWLTFKEISAGKLRGVVSRDKRAFMVIDALTVKLICRHPCHKENMKSEAKDNLSNLVLSSWLLFTCARVKRMITGVPLP